MKNSKALVFIFDIDYTTNTIKHLLKHFISERIETINQSIVEAIKFERMKHLAHNELAFIVQHILNPVLSTELFSITFFDFSRCNKITVKFAKKIVSFNS